jgi:surface antigen
LRPDRRHGLSLLPYIGNTRALRKAFGQQLSNAQTAFFLCLALGGCSVSLPMASLMPPGSHDDDDSKTASIPDSQIAGLAGEDWRLARIALESAMGTGGNGAAVPWNNPNSGLKGSFTPVGDAYATDTGTCRGFQAAIDRKDANEDLQGTACTDKSGDWQITDVKPWKKS